MPGSPKGALSGLDQPAHSIRAYVVEDRRRRHPRPATGQSCGYMVACRGQPPLQTW